MSKPWCSTEIFDKLDLDSLKEQSLLLNAPIVDVQKVLEKPLKPMRKQVSVVRFAGGSIEEITSTNIGLVMDAAAEPSPAADSARSEAASTAAATAAGAADAAPKKKKPAVAATVAAPTIGCPAPDFDEADVRAERVLVEFLDADQLNDFLLQQQFLVTGGETGHRYLLTSRHAPKARFKAASFRCVYDLDEGRDLCVHDWEVPAAEELLGLAIHLQVPGLEGYVRHLPE